MKKGGILTAIVMLSAVLLFAAGCGKSDPLVGSWSGAQNNSTANYDLQLVMKDDGTYTLHLKMSTATISFDGDYSGTYESTDSTVTFTSQSMVTNSGDSTQGEILNSQTKYDYEISGQKLTLKPAEGQEGIPFTSLTLTKG